MSPKQIVVFSALLIAIGPISIDTFLPSLPFIANDLQVAPEITAQLVSVYLIFFAAGFLVVGVLADSYGRRPLLLGGLVIYALASVMAVFAPNFEILLLARVIQALGASSINNTARALIRDVVEPKDMTKSFALVGSVIAIAPLIAPFLGGVLQEIWGWRSTFAIMLVMGIIYLGVIYFKLNETAEKLAKDERRFKDHLRAFKDILAHKHFQAYSFIIVGQFINLFAYLTISSFIFIDVMGLSAREYGLVFPLTAGAFILGNYMNRKYFHGKPYLLLLGVCLIFTSMLLINIGGLVGGTSPLFLVIPMMINSFASSITMSIGFAGASAPFRKRAATATSLQSILQYAFGSLSAAIAGFMHDAGMKALGLIFIVGFSIVLIGYFKTRKLTDKVH